MWPAGGAGGGGGPLAGPAGGPVAAFCGAGGTPALKHGGHFRINQEVGKSDH